MENQSEPFDVRLIPPREQLESLVSMLQQVDLTKVSYQKVYYSIRETLWNVPFPIAELEANSVIDRGRIHSEEQLFTSERDVSYKADSKLVKDFGRCNIPGQSIFYGSIPTVEVEYPRVTLLHELDDQYRHSKDRTEWTDVWMTVGKWRTIHKLSFMDIAFNENAIRNNKRIRESYDAHMKILRDDLGERFDDMVFLLKFFSDQFAQEQDEPKDVYKISAALTNFLLSRWGHQIAGLTYPSPRMNLEASNVIMPVHVAESYLCMEKVALVHVHFNGQTHIMNIPKTAIDLGPMNSDFKWLDVNPTNDGFATLTPVK